MRLKALSAAACAATLDVPADVQVGRTRGDVPPIDVTMSGTTIRSRACVAMATGPPVGFWRHVESCTCKDDGVQATSRGVRVLMVTYYKQSRDDAIRDHVHNLKLRLISLEKYIIIIIILLSRSERRNLTTTS